MAVSDAAQLNTDDKRCYVVAYFQVFHHLSSLTLKSSRIMESGDIATFQPYNIHPSQLGLLISVQEYTNTFN